MDYDANRAIEVKRKDKNLQDSLDIFLEAKKLARDNSLELVQHSQWHFSLTRCKNGERKWRRNIYPSNQRIWWDKKCGQAPYLNLPVPWTLLDVVKEAVKLLKKC